MAEDYSFFFVSLPHFFSILRKLLQAEVEPILLFKMKGKGLAEKKRFLVQISDQNAVPFFFLLGFKLDSSS